MAQQRRRRRKVTPEMYRRIHELSEEGPSRPSARMILDKLEEEGFPEVGERTVHDVLAEQAPSSGKWWTLANTDADPADARLVLEVMEERARHTGSREWWITKDLATWLIRVRRARPDLDPWRAYLIARQYQIRSRNEEASYWDLDAELAMPPELFEKVMARFGSFAWGRPLPEEEADGGTTG